MNKNLKKIIATVLFSASFATALNSQVYASSSNCTSYGGYGGGESCDVNISFDIDKEVRKCKDWDEDNNECDNWSDWDDKVTGVEKGQYVEFRLEVKNESDDDAKSFDDVKVEDTLPSSLERTDGAGLTEYFDDFEPGEKETLYITAKVKDSEFDNKNFEKCVVNKAEVQWDDEDFDDADTATVCYGDTEVTELPQTGATSTLAFSGLGMVLSGIFLKKRN